MTLIEAEYKAVREAFELTNHLLGTNYVATAGASGVYDVIATRSDQWGSMRTGQVLRALIEDFRPPFIVLIGIAGGIRRPNEKPSKTVELGDVVIPDYISYFDLKKLVGGKTERALVPYDHPSHYLRRNFAEPLCSIKPERWTGLLTVARPEPGTPTARIGHLVAGETLLGDDESKVQQQVLRDFPTALAVDMESYGVASEIFDQRISATYNPQYLVVRGISDLVQQKQRKKRGDPPSPAPPATNQETRDRWREYAAHTAAMFARVLVTDLLTIMQPPAIGSGVGGGVAS